MVDLLARQVEEEKTKVHHTIHITLQNSIYLENAYNFTQHNGMYV